ncbi:Epoxide hydrolase 2 [Phytophthora cinnamomi]|uniref:Epoxide hydrolase 2 n=1 Tax=Phytophthora cinnamomi TaxID=4785 RepID=UPI00355A8556|nr:Epoxide hydrolase 2 [Phytophthora cinnamomi]
MDSKLPSLFPRRHYLDIVDDAWITDALSDDEIEVPPALDVDPNGSESPTGEPPMWAADEKVDRWNDLGLDQWVKDTA